MSKKSELDLKLFDIKSYGAMGNTIRIYTAKEFGTGREIAINTIQMISKYFGEVYMSWSPTPTPNYIGMAFWAENGGEYAPNPMYIVEIKPVDKDRQTT